MKRLRIIAYLWMVLGLGCSGPHFKVGQKEVPKPVDLNLITEPQRQAADLLARTVTEPKPMVPVAQNLSASLGSPIKPIPSNDLQKASDAAVEGLRAENVRLRKALDKQRDFLRKYEGNKIEDTGWDIGGLLTGSGFLAFVAVLIFVPGAMGVFLLIIHRLRATLTSTVTAVEQFRIENPKAAEQLDGWSREKMDTWQKNIINLAKSKINPKDLTSAHDYVSDSTVPATP